MSASKDNPGERSRLPHAILDVSSRVLKAQKIVELLGRERFMRARAVLEIGCGSGVISSTLVQLGSPGLHVQAVDVVDSRVTKEGYGFHLVDGTQLPFETGSFDIVISNHVIEHVGDRNAQLDHLGEISRVMNQGASTYLAVPNKWRFVEPHYRLPFLSWLPVPLADAYLRATSKGQHYDCVPLSAGEAEALFEEAGFVYRDLTFEAIKATLQIEHAQAASGRLATRMLSPGMASIVKPVISTLIYELTRPAR